MEREFLFCVDNWAGCGVLKNVYPRLFSLSSLKDAKVSKLGVWSNGVWEWKVAWRRRLFDWEKSLENLFVQAFQERCPILEEEDRWVWKDGEFPKYTVTSAYNCLRRFVEEENISVYNKFWRSKASLLALVYAWRVSKNKIATRVNLEKRGITVESLLFCFCGVEEESCHHLFFECRIVWKIWSQCFAWLEVSFVSHNEPILNFHQFRMCNASATVNEV